MAVGGYSVGQSGTIHVEGLAELRRQLRIVGNVLDENAGAELKAANKAASEIVAKEAKARAPYDRGDLFRTIRPANTQKGAYVYGGPTARSPHFIVQEFGGTIPRYHSKKRTFVKPRKRSGYFFYPALENKQRQVVGAYSLAIDAILKRYF